MEQKSHQWYYVNIVVSKKYNLQSTRQALNLWNKNSLTGFIAFLNHNTSNIPNLSNLTVNLGLVSQPKCDDMFLDLKSDHIFSYFLVTYLVYIYIFSFVVIMHLLRRGGGIGIYCQLIPNLIKLTRSQILFLTQCMSRIQNQIGNTTWRSISIYHRVITLTLFIFFDCNRIRSL